MKRSKLSLPRSPIIRSVCFFSMLMLFSLFVLNSLVLAKETNHIPGQVMVKFKYDEIELPQGRGEAEFDRVSIRSVALKQILQRLQVDRFRQIVPTVVKGDTVRTLPDGTTIKLADFSQLYLLTFPPALPVDTVLAALENVEPIIYAEPDQYTNSDAEPDDQFFVNGDQWHLKQDSDEDIDAPEAWDLSKGDGINVAIIDQGVRVTHEDLAGKIAEGGETTICTTCEDPNHGTKVAGVVGAATDNNGIGVAGVGWNAKIIPYNDNQQLSQSIADINAAVSAGADIINMSWNNRSYSQSFKEALQNAFAQGVTLVASAGNINSDEDPLSAIRMHSTAW